MEEVQRHSVHTLVFRSLKRTHDFFVANQALLPEIDEKLEKMKYSIKARDSYKLVFDRAAKARSSAVKSGETGRPESASQQPHDNMLAITAEGDADYNLNSQTALVPAMASSTSQNTAANSVQVLPKKAPTIPKPKWHAPWKLYRVISGHLGWVRCVAVEPGNEWFATGAADRVIKVWDLASGKLKLSLTGHVSTVRGLCVSPRHPYLFSCGEDRQVKCWDLEYNKVIRHYHGHLSAVYTMALHPTIDVLVTAGRDSTARVWDMRTKVNIHTLTGHTNTVASVVCQAANPQIITGSHDSTVRLWDLAAGKSMGSLTNHKKKCSQYSSASIIIHVCISFSR